MDHIARSRPRIRLSIALVAIVAIGAAGTTAVTATHERDTSEPAADSAAAVAAAANRYAEVLSLEERLGSPSATATGIGATALNADTRRSPLWFHDRPTATSGEQAKSQRKPAAAKQTTTPAHTSTSTSPTAHKAVYAGYNHFWIPSLGMSYGVHSYACGRTSVPLNYIYRWGCAGHNNVYLLGHAWGVMKPLHDLYVRGGLRVGMVAVFADANGRVRKYRVTEWRVVRPTEIAWQIAAQPVPSMTLQTCIGKYSEYRLNVRLVAFT